ncbi:MAG: TonB-dependent receptor [Prevotella sp.]|nr:TonB-dependent receptor [Prevotella sp.]
MKQRLMVGLVAALAATQCIVAQATLQGDRLQEVVVTGTGTQHLLKDAPVQTEVISSRQLQAYGASSIEDILGGLSASFAFNEGDMGSQMQMNGLGNSYILILIDGKRIHGDVGGENDLSLIDPHDIERIEIVKGASSALYGSDAIAGVINIITKKHRQQGLLAENTTRVGSYGDLRQHNGLALNVGRFSSFTNFQLQHSDGWQNTAVENTDAFEQPITDSRNNTVNRHTNWQLAERLTYQLRPDIELYADGSIYWKRIYRPCGKYAKYDVKTYDLSYRNASAATGGRWKLNKTDVVTLDIDWNRHAYYHNFTKTTLTEGFNEQGNLVFDFPYFAGQRMLQSDQQRTMVHLKGVFTLPAGNRLSAGAEYRYDWLKAPTSIASQRQSDHTEAVYAQDEFTLWQPLNITAGLRLNHHPSFGLRLTPKVSAMLKAGDALRLRATWSEGFKTPTLKEQYYHYMRDMTMLILYLGNRDLRAQHSDYFSLGAEYTIGHLTASVTGYYNKVDDMITLVTVPTSEAPQQYRQEYGELLNKVRRYQNLDDAETFGADVSLRYAYREVTAGIGYSYLDTRAHLYNSDHDRTERVVIDGMAHHKANVYATWQHRCSPVYQFSVGLYGRASSKRYYQINGNGKGYQTWRITTGHDLTPRGTLSYRIEAGIDNLFNYCDRTPHGLHLGTTTPGRTVYAGLTIRLNRGKKLKNNYKSNSNYNNDEQD